MTMLGADTFYGTTIDEFGNLRRVGGSSGSAFPDPTFGTTTGTTTGTTGFLDDFLEEEPAIPYAGAIYGADSNLTPNQRRYFADQRSNIFNQFLGTLSDQIQGGGLPTNRFTDFVGEFDFNREYSNVFRGGQEQFAPRTRVFRR